MGVRGMREILEDAILYSKQRSTFGKKLHKHQVIRHKLGDMIRHLLACYALVTQITGEWIIIFIVIGGVNYDHDHGHVMLKILILKILLLKNPHSSNILSISHIMEIVVLKFLPLKTSLNTVSLIILIMASQNSAAKLATNPHDPSLAGIIAMAKVQTTKALEQVAREAMQIFGGKG
jgi:alkylation response protein AidB-like acyl-CoA dehydrogenase